MEESDIPNLPYIQAIVRETLRLHPGFTVLSRQSSQDCTVARYHIPANTEISVNEDGSIKKGLDVEGQQFFLLPFGSGRRICPEASLTLQIAPSTIGAVIQCFDWKVGDGGNGSINMEEGHGRIMQKSFLEFGSGHFQGPVVAIGFVERDGCQD